MSQVLKPRKGYKSLFLNKHSVIKANDYAQDWDFIELGDPKSGVFSNGVNKNKEDYGQGCLFVNILDVFREFTINPKKLKRVIVSKKEIENYRLIKGDLVLDRSSNIFETVGYPSYFDGADEPVVFSGFTFRYRPNLEVWNSKFLTFQLMSFPIRKLVISIGTKSANSNVNQNSYKKIRIPNPPLPEQEKIASILSNVDNLITSTQKIIEKTERLKKGLMQKLLTRGIGHDKFKKVLWLFGKEIEIPDDWKIKPVKELGKIITGSTPSTSNKEFFNGVYLWVSPSDFEREKYVKQTNFKLTEKGLKITRKIPKNAILVVCIGSTIGKIGMAYEEMTTNQQINSIICNYDDPNFVYYQLLQNNYLIKNMANQVAVPILNKTEFGKIKIFIPKKQNEQRKIASILSGIDASNYAQTQYKEKLERLKKSLMQKLLTGQIRVKV